MQGLCETQLKLKLQVEILGNHGFIDSLRLEGTSGDGLANAPVQGCSQLWPVQSLISPWIECQQPMDNLLECSITLNVKDVFSHFSCISVCAPMRMIGRKILFSKK